MSLPFPLWFSAFLLSKDSSAAGVPFSIPTTTIPLTLPSTIATTAAITPSTSAMTNYIIPQQPDGTPIEIMDRKKKKPVMEKQRRDRMNNALERLKVIIIRHDPNHTSKLEKADILEKTVELVEFFEFQLSQLQQQITAQTIGTIFDGLARNKCSPEIIKSVRDVILSIFPPPPQPQQLRQPLLQQQQQNIIPSASGIPPTMMPTFNAGRIPPPLPSSIHPLFFQAAAMNPLLLPQQRLPQAQAQQFLFQQFSHQQKVMMQQAPKASSAPVMTPPSSSTSAFSSSSTTTSTTSSTTNQVKSEIHSPTKTYETESRSNSRAAETDSSDGDDDDDGEDDVIDVEKLDDDEKHDETFSPPITPKINSRKRSRSDVESGDTVAAAAEENDSGIFDGPSPPKKKKATTTPAKTTFSIDGILK